MIISVAAYNRPEYMEEVLQALELSISVLFQYTGEGSLIVANIEPGCYEVENLARQYADYVTVNKEQKGCSGNTLLAVEAAFKIAATTGEDYVQHIEDDFVFAPDALLLSAWMRDEYRADASVLCSGISTAHAATPDEYLSVHKSDWFHCQGWGTWRDRWETRLKPSWQTTLGEVALGGWAQNFNDNAFHYLPASWDTQLGLDHFGRGKGDDDAPVPSVNGKLYQVLPRLSRVKHIGLEGGVHTTPTTFERDLPKVYATDVLGQPFGGYYALPGTTSTKP